MPQQLSKLMADGHYYFPVNGHFVSAEQQRTAEILKDYNSELELQWIPPDQRGTEQHPFRVVHRPPGRPPYLVLTAPEADARLLAQVFAADAQKAHGGRGQLLNWLDQYNNAVEIMNAKKAEEERQNDFEIAQAALNSPKYHYKAHGRSGELLDFGKPFGGRFG